MEILRLLFMPFGMEVSIEAGENFDDEITFVRQL